MHKQDAEYLHVDHEDSALSRLATEVIPKLGTVHKLRRVQLPTGTWADRIFAGGDTDNCYFDIHVQAALTYKALRLAEAKCLSDLLKDPGMRSSGGLPGRGQTDVMCAVFQTVAQLLPSCSNLKVL